MDDVVVRAREMIEAPSTFSSFDIEKIIDELIDSLEDERRDCRILEAIILDLRAADRRANGQP